MGTRYQHIVYGDAAVGTPDTGPQELDDRDIRMLTTAFAFHLASTTPAGWPYIQYRSGPPGFVHHLGGRRFGFADFRGNQQFVTVGNVKDDDRVALFLADHPLRRRMKAFGHARVIEADDDPELFDRLRHVDGQQIAAQCERSIVIEIDAVDWNCGRSIVPMYTTEQVRERVQPYVEQIHALQDEVADLRRRLADAEEKTDPSA